MPSPSPSPDQAERVRLDEDRRREKNWKRWGPYLSERQWGTVREDYSPDGDTGQGLGASHQTGWTALIVRLLEDFETSHR
jgi:hypothetical protein